MSKKKIFFIVINKIVIDVFLINHINRLSEKFDIEFISSTNLSEFFLNKKTFKNHYIDIKRSINIFNFFKNIFDLFKIIKKNNPHLVISIHPKNGLLVSICKSFSNLKNLHLITGQIWANEKYIKKYFFKIIDKFIISKSNFLLIDSKSQISFLRNEGFDCKKIKCIHNGSICGVPTNYFYKSNSNKKLFCLQNNIDINTNFILFTGRVNEVKGILLLLDAFKLLIDNDYNCHLLIIGDDEINLNLILEKTDFKYKNKILTFNYQKEINFFYSLSSLFCLPSYREGFGMSVIEASASSLPVVVSDIYGLNDSCINNITGLKFNNGNYIDLMNKLSFLLDNPNNSQKLGYSGKNFVEKNFKQKDVLDFMYNFINEIT